MEKEKTTITGLLFAAAIAANILFIVWILYNGVNEGFRGTLPERVSYISLIALLTVNTILLLRSRRQ